MHDEEQSGQISAKALDHELRWEKSSTGAHAILWIASQKTLSRTKAMVECTAAKLKGLNNQLP